MRMFSLAGFAAGFSAFVLAAPAANATCPIEVAGYIGGAFGADAAAANACFISMKDGARGRTSAATNFNGADANGNTFSLSATANLASGVLTATSNPGMSFGVNIASAAEWDSFTLTGLPAAGQMVTAILALSGAFTGGGSAESYLAAGSVDMSGDFNPIVDASKGYGVSSPGPLTVTYLALNNVTVTVLATVSAQGNGGTADLSDPPTLSIKVPSGTTVTSASGVFENIERQSVPEPASAALMIGGLLGVAALRRRG